MLESKLSYNRAETKNVFVAKKVEFIKTCNQYPCLILVIFSTPQSSSLSAEEKYKKSCLGEMVNFFLPGVVLIRTWGKFLLRDIRKNEQIQVFDSQIYFRVILTPLISNFSPTMVRNTGLRKNSRNILKRI